jgi:RNA polymerase-binding transcription factor DksA
MGNKSIYKIGYFINKPKIIKDLGMDDDRYKYYKNFIMKKRQEILETDNFSNWFADKSNGNPNECGEQRDSIHCLSRKNQSIYDKNDIQSKAKILQYLLKLDQALNLISTGNYGICSNCKEEIPINHLEKLPCTPHCPRCE